MEASTECPLQKTAMQCTEAIYTTVCQLQNTTVDIQLQQPQELHIVDSLGTHNQDEHSNKINVAL